MKIDSDELRKAFGAMIAMLESEEPTKQERCKDLRNGVYRIFWNDCDGHSVASIGRDTAGNVWMAPANWINNEHSFDWSNVERVELIERSPA